jgi:hypothetical protein
MRVRHFARWPIGGVLDLRQYLQGDDYRSWRGQDRGECAAEILPFGEVMRTWVAAGTGERSVVDLFRPGTG